MLKSKYFIASLFFISILTTFAQKNDSLNLIFLQAAYDNDFETLTAALSKGADINASSREGATALHFSVVQNNHQLCSFLIDRGANINVQDVDGTTPLHLATENGYVTLIQLLLWAGADVQMHNQFGETPLHLAVLSGNTLVCDMLLSFGASPNLPDNEGITPLHIAAFNGLVEIADLLLFYGANPNIKDINGMNAAHHAVLSLNVNLLQVLTEYGVDLLCTEKNGFNVFQFSLLYGTEAITDFIFGKILKDQVIKGEIGHLFNTHTYSRLWKIILQKDDLNKIRLLQKYKIQRPFYPVAGAIYGRLGIAGGEDFFTHVDIALQEVNYKLFFNLGYGSRLWRNRIYFLGNNDTLYQMNEYRAMIYPEIVKYITLFKFSDNETKKVNFYAGLRTTFTWSNYSGSQYKSSKIYFIPIAGIELTNQVVRWQISYQYWNYDTFNFMPHLFSINFAFRIKQIQFHKI